MSLKSLHLPKARILVLDDDSVHRAALRNLLTGAGYVPAECADSGHSAGRIDLVLAGIASRPMPGAAPRLRDWAAPVILLIDRSAWLGFDFFDAADAFGAVAVLQRPFPRVALLRLVATVLSQPAAVPAFVEDDEPLLGSAEFLCQLETPNFA